MESRAESGLLFNVHTGGGLREADAHVPAGHGLQLDLDVRP